jgi:asparagine synthase (glutamine-hydrolysing)
MYFHLKISLPDHMLTKVDRMTMASSLEARVPFLDHRVVELLSQVDKRVKLPGLHRKAILRQTVARSLPPPLLRASKRGFVVPLSAWFRADDQNHLLTNVSADNLGLSADALTQILQEHRSGRADHGNFLWMLLVLQRVMASN